MHPIASYNEHWLFNHQRVDVYPEPPSWLDLFLEKRQPRLPAALAEAARELDVTSPRLLQLPPEIARLAAPF